MSRKSASDRSLRIMIVDDHEVIRRGLRAMIEAEGWQICCEASTGREACEAARVHVPDVIVLDISMPELNGIDAARQIRQAAPRSELLVLTMHDSEPLLRQALQCGAHGYVLKSDAGRELVAAIEALREHKRFFSSGVAGTILGGYLRSDGSAKKGSQLEPRLGAREREIVRLLAEGRNNKEVAKWAGMTVKAVEAQRASILRKLGVHSIADLVRYAVRNKLIQP